MYQYIPAAATVAGGLLGKMFGGDSNIDKSPGMQQTTKDLLLAAYPSVRGAIGRSPRLTEAGISPLFEQGVEQVQGALPGMAEQVGAAQGAWGQGLNAPDVANNPYMQGILSTLESQGGRFLNEQVMPGLRRSSIAGGMYGGGRSGVNEGVAAGRVAQNVTDAQRQALMQGYGQGLTHQRGLLGMSPTMAGLGALPGQIAMQAGGTAQDAQLAEMRAQIERQQSIDNLRYGPMSNWIGSHATMWGSGPPQQYPKASSASQGAGVGMIAGGLLQNLFKPTPQTTALNLAGSTPLG